VSAPSVIHRNATPTAASATTTSVPLTARISAFILGSLLTYEFALVCFGLITIDRIYRHFASP